MFTGKAFSLFQYLIVNKRQLQRIEGWREIIVGVGKNHIASGLLYVHSCLIFYVDHIRKEHSYCRMLSDEEDEYIEALDVVETVLPLEDSMDVAYSWSSSLKMSPEDSPEMPSESPESYILPD